MPTVDGHKDGLGGVVLHWLTQKGFREHAQKPFL